MKKEVRQQLEIIKENTVDLLPEEELVAKLESSLHNNKPLRLKIGFDPTASDIHLGHTVLLHKLRKLQDLGHQVHFIIGDFTAKIGDPSGRTALRPVLTDKEIKKNAATYTQQAFKILDKRKTKIIYNSIWYKDMKISDFLSILSSYTTARMLERDDFAQRMKQNKPLTILELVYPLIQGFDSVKCEADIEFGGTDQKFNLLVGRHLQEVFGMSPQIVVTMPLLVGLDGKSKMSKSLGNYIGITEKPKDMFGKLMSVSDELMWEYFRLLTEHNLDEVKKMHPKEAKLLLAQTIVSCYYSQKEGLKEKEEFERVFSQKKLPASIKVVSVGSLTADIVKVLSEADMVSSKNEVRRLLKQGGIATVDAVTLIQAPLTVQELKIPPEGLILKLGKKKFLKITV